MPSLRDLHRSSTFIHWISVAATSVALAVIAAGNPAHADGLQGEALDQDGKMLMAKGKVARACEAFEASNRADPSAGTLIHLGFCREENGQLASAWHAYRTALARAKDPAKQKLAATRVAALESRLSRLTVSVSEDRRIHGLVVMCNGKALDPDAWNRGLPVDGGDYVIAGRAPGHVDWQITAHVPVEGSNVSIEVPRFEALPTPLRTTLATDAPPRAPAIAGEDRDEGGLPAGSTNVIPAGNRGRHKTAIALAIVGVVGIGVGTGLALESSTLENRAEQLCPHHTCADQPAVARAVNLNDSARRDALLADIGVAAGGAAIIGAAVLWLTASPRPHPSTAIVPILNADRIAVTLARSF